MITLRPTSHLCLFASESHTLLFNTHSSKGGECIDGGDPLGCMYGDIFATYVNISAAQIS